MPTRAWCLPLTSRAVLDVAANWSLVPTVAAFRAAKLPPPGLDGSGGGEEEPWDKKNNRAMTAELSALQSKFNRFIQASQRGLGFWFHQLSRYSDGRGRISAILILYSTTQAVRFAYFCPLVQNVQVCRSRGW